MPVPNKIRQRMASCDKQIASVPSRQITNKGNEKQMSSSDKNTMQKGDNKKDVKKKQCKSPSLPFTSLFEQNKSNRSPQRQQQQSIEDVAKGIITGALELIHTAATAIKQHNDNICPHHKNQNSNKQSRTTTTIKTKKQRFVLTKSDDPTKNYSDTFIHKRHKCDGCNSSPLIGLRYHAVNRYNFDLCFDCFHAKMALQKKEEEDGGEKLVKRDVEDAISCATAGHDENVIVFQLAQLDSDQHFVPQKKTIDWLENPNLLWKQITNQTDNNKRKNKSSGIAKRKLLPASKKGGGTKIVPQQERVPIKDALSTVDGVVFSSQIVQTCPLSKSSDDDIDDKCDSELTKAIEQSICILKAKKNKESFSGDAKEQCLAKRVEDEKTCNNNHDVKVKHDRFMKAKEAAGEIEKGEITEENSWESISPKNDNVDTESCAVLDDDSDDDIAVVETETTPGGADCSSKFDLTASHLLAEKDSGYSEEKDDDEGVFVDNDIVSETKDEYQVIHADENCSEKEDKEADSCVLKSNHSNSEEECDVEYERVAVLLEEKTQPCTTNRPNSDQKKREDHATTTGEEAVVCDDFTQVSVNNEKDVPYDKCEEDDDNFIVEFKVDQQYIDSIGDDSKQSENLSSEHFPPQVYKCPETIEGEDNSNKDFEVINDTNDKDMMVLVSDDELMDDCCSFSSNDVSFASSIEAKSDYNSDDSVPESADDWCLLDD